MRAHQRLALLLVGLLALGAAAVVRAASPRGPIIGVFAHPVTAHGEYIAASYVKWVEMAGGRVVPVPYTAPEAYLDELIPRLNGFLFPGGAADVNDRARHIYRLALALNDRGVHFPVWGTCLGFEWLLQLTADDRAALDGDFDAMNITLPLNFTPAAPTSRLFGPVVGTPLYDWLATRPITMNNHHQGITPATFARFPKLPAFYEVLATNVDRAGREFIAAMEAKAYPIFAVQFHPEKNSFEYGEYPDGRPYEVIDHSPEAIRMGQYFANFFIDEARKNDLAFASAEEERAALIYNYHTSTFTAPGFVESYLFKHEPTLDYWRLAIKS